jgi:AmmeMemoRadiSam system protein A
MMPGPLNQECRNILLRLARESVQQAVVGYQLPPLDLSLYPECLVEPGASFVTLTENGELRGCIGALEAYQPLIEDVREHAAAAATRDYRFLPVTADEIPAIHIEVSRLTPPVPLKYTSPEELIAALRPGIDGVVLRDGGRRATFLPQVWDKIPDPAEFLTHLCLKMGLPGHAWRQKPLQVAIYRVEEFQEE